MTIEKEFPNIRKTIGALTRLESIVVASSLLYRKGDREAATASPQATIPKAIEPLVNALTPAEAGEVFALGFHAVQERLQEEGKLESATLAIGTLLIDCASSTKEEEKEKEEENVE